MPKKRRRGERMAETIQMAESVPLFDKLVFVRHKDDAIRARSRSGNMEREGAMTKALFLKLVMKGVTLLNEIGYLPTFTALGPLERIDDRVAFRLGFNEMPDLFLEGFVSVEVAERARDELNDLLPRRVVRFAQR